MHRKLPHPFLMTLASETPGGGGGGGQSTTETPTVETKTPAETEEADPAKEIEKWKALSRKNEDLARANAEKAKRLDEIEEQSKTDLQKAQDKAAAAQKEADDLRTEVLRSRVAREKGVTEELLVGSTKEELEASADRLLAWRGTAENKPGAATSSQVAGERGDSIQGPKQLTREDLKTMTAAQIDRARKDGQLNELMGIKDPVGGKGATNGH